MENGSVVSAGLSDSEQQQQQQRRNTSQLDRRHVVEKVQQQHDPLRRGNSSPRGLGTSTSSGSGTAGAQPTTTTASAANSATMATATTTTTTTTASMTANASAYTTTMNGANAGVGNSDMPSTMKLLSELERSWAMFSASWKVVDLFGGMQIYQQQTVESQTEPLNGMLLSTSSAGLVAFLAGSIGGGGIITAVLLTLFVVFGALWTMTANRVRGQVPSFKNMRVVDGTPSEIFLYLMNVKNYPIWDASVERAEVVHTIDDHSDIIHIVYRPVWMWPMWVMPRDLCLLRYWRRAEDGSYVICLQSAIHPECPPTHGIIRAKCNGGGFTISPRGVGLAQSDEFTSMVTNVIHLDPQGWEGKLLQRLGNMHVYLRPQILALTGLQEVMEARKYVCPNVPEEFSAAMASAEDASTAIAAEQQGENGAGGVTNEGEAVVPLQEFPCNVPRSMWAEPDGSAMLVRGPDYLTDRRKIPSAPPAFRLMGVDVFNSSKAIEHIASRPDNIVQKEIKRHEAQGTEMPFTFVINFVVPGNPRINMVLYYQAPNPSILKEGTAFGDLMSDFLDGTDDFRDERFKLIPCIVEGSFIVRQAVGSTPAIIGKKLRQPCYRSEKYFELDVDIGSSAVANRVVGLVSGYTKKLVIDMGFLIEGQRYDELPERLFGSVRLLYIDLSIATKLD